MTKIIEAGERIVSDISENEEKILVYQTEEDVMPEQVDVNTSPEDDESEVA